MKTRNLVPVCLHLFVLFTAMGFAQSTVLDYFKGSWTVIIKGGPQGGFRWEVADALDTSWIAGVVTRGDKEISRDFWRTNGKRIDRMAFSSNQLNVSMSSQVGWEGNKLVLMGSAENGTGKFEVRETITKIDADKFHALWERRDGPNSKWTVFSDETCTRQKPSR